MADLKILAQKFKELTKNHEIATGTWVELVFSGKRFMVKYGVLDEKYQTIRVTRDSRIAMVRYENDGLRRKDKFNRHGKLVRMVQTKKRKPHGSQVNLRGNDDDWMHKVPDSDLREVLEDLSAGENYVILIGPGIPGKHNDTTSIYGQFGRDILADHDGKLRLQARFVKGDTNVTVCHNKKGKKWENKETFELADL